MSGQARLLVLDAHAILTPADHQTHRRFGFQVPRDCRELRFHIHYEPRLLAEHDSVALTQAAIARQAAALAGRVGEELAARWLADFDPRAQPRRIANLVTASLDDATGAYRGAGHRHANDQRLALGLEAASLGLVAGPLPPGKWTLTMSAHTLVSAQCELSIQIGAEMAASC